jgi:hypothetical protein
MKPTNVIRTLASIFGAVAASAFLAAPAWAQQASINLEGSSLSYCNTSQNTWSVTKTADTSSVTSGNPVTWTITATKNPDLEGSPPVVLCAEGTITISNSGAVPASIGNIVVNLQKQVKVAGKWRWVSAAADVATSCNALTYPLANCGDAATSAKVVASASAENPAWNSAPGGAGNYSVSGGVGTFSETAASGSIQFTDASNNTLFSITPDFNVAEGAPVTLKYKANFDNALLGISGGTVLRTEVIVTFGNAGGRGGSGASLEGGVDINGNGLSTDGGEDHVRSVPIRLTSTLPAYVNCNNEVSLLDAIAPSDGAAYLVTSNNLPATTSTSGSWQITAILSGNGTVTNTVDLFSKEPYASDACCDKVDESAESRVTVTEEECTENCTPPPPSCRTDPSLCPKTGEYCTFTNGWQQKASGHNPGAFRESHWSLVFGNLTSGPETGIPGASGFSAQFLGPVAVENYQDNGTPGAFTVDMVFNGSNPGGTSAGIFGTQVLRQVLAIKFSDAGPFVGADFVFNKGYKDLLVNTVHGQFSIGQIVDMANTALGGGSLGPFGSISELNELLDKLNNAYVECGEPSEWAVANITKP